MTLFALAAATATSALWVQADRRLPTFGATAALVRLDVLAMDRGVPVRGLKADDFEVRDKGVTQTFRLTAADQLPWELVIVFDTSASVNGTKLESLKACGRAVAEALRPGDRAALLTFSHVIELRCPMTDKRLQLLNALDTLRAGGSTALFDAVFVALAVSGASQGRPLLLLFSDGRDNVSWLSASDVIAAARLSETPIYAVSTSDFGDASRSRGGPPTWASIASASDDVFLRRITRETGGRIFQAESTGHLKKSIATVLEEMGASYLIGYDSKGVPEEGWHKVDVRLRHRHGTVVARPGYLVPSRPGGAR